MRRFDELNKGSLFNKQEVALINNQLNMVNSKCEGDTTGDFQQKENLCVHYSDVIKVTDEVVASEGKGLERDEDGVEHIKKETRSKRRRQRAPPFMSDGLLCESKSLLRKNAMHEEANDEDKAWLASLSDVEVDMLISIKKLAMERAKTIKDKRVIGIFTSRVLRTIGLLLNEFIRERLKDVHFPAQATDTLNIRPNDHENRFSPKVEEENDSIIRGDDVGEVWKEMTAEQDRKRKRFSPKVEEENDSIIRGDDVGEVWKEMTAEQDRKRKRFSLKVEEENDSIIRGDDVGEVWKEMTAEQDRKRKRHVSCEQMEMSSINRAQVDLVPKVETLNADHQSMDASFYIGKKTN